MAAGHQAQDVQHAGANPAPSGEPAASPPLARGPGRSPRSRAMRREAMFGYAMISVAVLAVVVFTALPILASFVLAFFSWDIISPPHFVGLANFRELFADHSVIESFRVTIILTVLIVALQVIVGLALALLVQQRRSALARGIFRTAFFLPLLASAASISIVMSYIFDQNFGVVNYYLKLIGLAGVPWSGSSAGATAAIVLVAVWQSLGFTFVLFVAALSALPKDVMEAARVDGSGPVRTLLRVKLPLISPTIFFAVVVGFLNAMQLFDQPYVLTKGGPDYATRTTVMLIYQTAFGNLRFGYGSAISVILFVVLLILTGLQFLASRRWVFYS